MADGLVGVYAGTFDPITNGHMDIIQRAARMLDRLIVAVAVNAGKGPMFELDQRIAMVQDEVGTLNDVRGAVVIRGLRAVSDFEYEFQMASMNAKIAPEVETVCLMASDKNQFIASRLVKEIAMLHGDVSQFVSPRVEKRLKKRVAG